MSTAVSITLFVACPLIGTLCAIYGRYTRPWQVLFGAVVGAAVADVIFRVCSKHTIGLAMSGKATGVVVWSTDIDWSGRLIWNTILLTFALGVGGLVLLVRRFAPPPT